MTDANTELKQTAIQIANDLEGRNLHLHEEIKQAELHVAELKLKLEASRAARQRSLDFSPMLRGDYQCPDCFVSREVVAIITPRPSDNRTDLFACKTCGMEFTFDA